VNVNGTNSQVPATFDRLSVRSLNDHVSVRQAPSEHFLSTKSPDRDTLREVIPTVLPQLVANNARRALDAGGSWSTLPRQIAGRPAMVKDATWHSTMRGGSDGENHMARACR
jgi:hypothetical protein